MATTVRQLMTGALRLINVVQANEVPSAEDMNITLQAFDGMIDNWSNDELMIYTVNPYTFTTVAGVKDYTLGPGGDWDTIRPMSIEQAYVQWNNFQQAVDMPVALLNDAQFASISVKNTPSSFPFALYDNGNYPLRTITVWPVPTVPTPMKLWLRQPLIDFTNLDEEVSYPPGYVKAFRFNLACEIAPEFGKEIPQIVGENAMISKKELKKLNATPQYKSGDGGMNAARIPFNWITGGFVPFTR